MTQIHELVLIVDQLAAHVFTLDGIIPVKLAIDHGITLTSAPVSIRKLSLEILSTTYIKGGSPLTWPISCVAITDWQ